MPMTTLWVYQLSWPHSSAILGLLYSPGENFPSPPLGGIFPIFLFDDILQVVVNLCSNVHGFPEVCSTKEEDQKLLRGQLVSSMRTTTDHTESLNWQNDFQIVNMSAMWRYRTPLLKILALQMASVLPQIKLAQIISSIV